MKSNQQFYIREGLRKRPLDVPEIRSLFLHSADQGKRVRDFRTDRVGALLSGQSPVRLVDAPLLVAHFVPTDSITGDLAVDPVSYVEGRYIPVLGASTTNARTNLDGALVVRPVGDAGSHGYSLFFRNGYFEAVKVLTGQAPGEGLLPSAGYEQDLMKLLEKLRTELVELHASTEMVAMLSVLHADRVVFGVSRQMFDLDDGQGRFDRATIALPDVLLRADDEPAVALRPLFDLMWQAAGFTGSFNYNDQGKWVGQR